MISILLLKGRIERNIWVSLAQKSHSKLSTDLGKWCRQRIEGVQGQSLDGPLQKEEERREGVVGNIEGVLRYVGEEPGKRRILQAKEFEEQVVNCIKAAEMSIIMNTGQCPICFNS